MGGDGASLPSAEDRVFASVAAAFGRATRFDAPYAHWIMQDLLPADVIDGFTAFDLPAPDVGDLSGKREYHNETRHYLDRETIARHPCAAALANAFQSPRMVTLIEASFGADIDDTFLRVEYAQDKTGFWLEPHTDIGVKRLTLLCYLPGDDQDDLGTDVYDASKNWVKRPPFDANSAFAFVPGPDTYHGFERREIKGVRRSLILNYVTHDWRAREQLCFPEATARRG